MPASRAVLDASAVVRAVGFPDPAEDALVWLESINDRRVEALAPELIFAEVANALLGYVRADVLSIDGSVAILNRLLRLPIRVFALRELVVPALSTAEARGLSVYDACYVVLAEQAKAPLLTADGKAAAATAESILLE